MIISITIGCLWACRAVLLPDSTVVAREWLNTHLPEDATIAVDWSYVPRLLDEAELEGLRADLRSDMVRSEYAELRGFRTVPMGWTDETLETTEAEYIVTSSGCLDRFFEFGWFTMRPPAPGSPLREQFEETRAFYDALLSGYAGWSLVYWADTGNGPRVLVFERREPSACEPLGLLPWVGMPDYHCR